MENNRTQPSDLKLIGREEVLAILEPTEGLTVVDLKPGDNISVNFQGTKEQPAIEIGDRNLTVTPEGLTDAGRCIGLSKRFVKKCPPDRLFPILNYFYGDGMTDPLRAITSETSLSRITKEQVKMRVNNNVQLLGIAENILGLDHIVGYHQVYTDLDYSSMGIVTDRSFAPIEEDTLFGGIRVYNSLVGREAIEVVPYIFRQWCSNGAITEHSLGRYTRKIEKKNPIDDWFHEIIQGVDQELEREFERIRSLTGISVKGHVAETVQSIGKDRHLSESVIENVVDRAVSENAETVYDVWNAFTWVASHDEELKPRVIKRLQRTAGIITSDPTICETCHRIIN